MRSLRAHLDEKLFRSALPTAIGRAEGALLVAALLTLGILLQLLRLGWSASLDTLWAEDGTVFLHGAVMQGFGESLSATYAGYMVLVQSLIGEAATLVPLHDAAAAVSILSATVVALSGVAVWFAAGGHIRDPYLRGALAVVAVLVPVAGQESVDSASYVSWYMLFASFWLLLLRPRTSWGAALASLFILVTALSNPGIWFLLPLAVLRALAGRGGRDVAILCSYFVGSAAQAVVVALNTETTAEPAWSWDIWTAFAQRVVDGAALGLRLGGIAWESLGWLFLGALLAGVAAGFVLGLRRSTPAARWLAAICIATSVPVFVASIYQRGLGAAAVWPVGDYTGAAARYTIVPALLLVSAALALVDDSSRRRGGRSWATLAAVAIVTLSIATSFDLRYDSAREEPRWGGKVTEAAAVCAAANVTEVAIPITPVGWAVGLPCDEVKAAAGGPGPG